MRPRGSEVAASIQALIAHHIRDSLLRYPFNRCIGLLPQGPFSRFSSQCHLISTFPALMESLTYAPSTSTTNRRGKRTADTTSAASNKSTTRSSTSTALQTANNVVTLPLLLLIHIMALFYQLASNILPEPIIRPIANMMESSSETDKLLEEMPAKQSKLQSDIGKVDKDQTKLKEDMENLRERIQKIQERRERWAKQAAEIDREKTE